MERKVSVFDAVVYGLRSFLDSFRLFFLTGLLYLITNIFVMAAAVIIFLAFAKGIEKSLFEQKFETVGKFIEQLMPALQTLTTDIKIIVVAALFVFLFVNAFLLTGLYGMALEYYDTGSSHVSRLFQANWRYVFTIFATFILYFILVFFGLLAFIIPGIYLALRLILFPFFILDHNAGVLDSLKGSWRLTSNYVWQLFAIHGTQLVLFSGILTIWSMVFGVLAYVHIYRALSASKN